MLVLVEETELAGAGFWEGSGRSQEKAISFKSGARKKVRGERKLEKFRATFLDLEFGFAPLSSW